MDDVERKLGLSRESLVGLGLLLGCDFVPHGVPGVGRETVLKILAELDGKCLLRR
jgi:flap endonuclease GEN